MSWRETARGVVMDVLRRTKSEPEKAIQAALTAAYPFDQRANWPYKIWLDEVARQRGTWKKPKPRKKKWQPTPTPAPGPTDEQPALF